MYMLEGGSRWNMNRTRESMDMSVASHTRLYDVRLMTNVNDLSNRVLGFPLLPEFIPPGKPTGEIIIYDAIVHLFICLSKQKTTD